MEQTLSSMQVENEKEGKKQRGETRPDTRQDSRGRLGWSRYAKTAGISEIFVTYRLTDQGVELRVCD